MKKQDSEEKHGVAQLILQNQAVHRTVRNTRESPQPQPITPATDCFWILQAHSYSLEVNVAKCVYRLDVKLFSICISSVVSVLWSKMHKNINHKSLIQILTLQAFLQMNNLCKHGSKTNWQYSIMNPSSLYL